ncbi:MAG: MAPEG family protein [Sphingobium sp.]
MYIFLPILAIVALTFFAIFRMAAGRAAAVKGGQDPDYYRAHLGDPEPEATVAAVRHYGNLMELPIVFYTGCIAAYALQAVGGWTLAFAWGYVAARLAQSAIHLSYNNPAHRGLAFMVGVAFQIALWINLTLSILARL